MRGTALAVYREHPSEGADNMVSKDDDRNSPASQPVPNDRARQREAQDRARGRSGQASSPVDAKHVDAPHEQDNTRGHRQSQ